MSPHFLTLDEIMDIHRDQIERYGGTLGVRDAALLAGYENSVDTPTIHWSVRLGQQIHTTQDAQKDRPARPQRAKRRGVRFGTLSF